MDDRDLVTGTASWVARTDASFAEVGPSTENARALAKEFLAQLREGSLSTPTVELDEIAMDVLNAAIELLAEAPSVGPDETLSDASRLYDLMLCTQWPQPDFGESTELLRACCLWAWRQARRAGMPGLAQKWAARATSVQEAAEIHGFSVDPDSYPSSMAEGKAAAEGSLSVPSDQRRAQALELRLEDPETLLEVCRLLRERMDAMPLAVRSDAEFFYQFLAEPKRPIGLFDEREYFLGEFALIAGHACRMLALRNEAKRWFDRSEAAFRLTVNAVAEWSRVSYQRLALLVEERDFENLFEQLPALVDSFRNLDMESDALKCGFLEGVAQLEMGDLEGARKSFEHLLDESKRLADDKLVATAYANLVHVLGMQDEADEALKCSEEAVDVFRRLGNGFGLAKVQWGVASLLRSQGRSEAAITAFESARTSFEALGMMADVAAANLVIADLLLEGGNPQRARLEVLRALPLIEEYQLASEKVAALSLLKASLSMGRLDAKALRQLHGFFGEPS